MSNETKRDLKISFFVGTIAGILLLPTLNNIGVTLNLQRSILAVLSLIVLTPSGYLVAYWLSGWIPVMIQFIKFAIVGGLNAMIDLGILNLLIYSTGIVSGFYYSIFKSVSFLAAVTNSYFWNKHWTFRAGDAPATIEFLKFFLVNLVGFGINVGAASIVVNIIGVPAGISGELWANIGAVSAVFISLFWNFIGMKFIVFKK